MNYPILQHYLQVQHHVAQVKLEKLNEKELDGVIIAAVKVVVVGAKKAEVEIDLVLVVIVVKSNSSNQNGYVYHDLKILVKISWVVLEYIDTISIGFKSGDSGGVLK